MKQGEIDIYNEVDNFVEENGGEVTHTEIAQHFFELGRNNAINNACEWIERNYHATPMGGYYYLPEDCIEQFKQAMKGE